MKTLILLALLAFSGCALVVDTSRIPKVYWPPGSRLASIPAHPTHSDVPDCVPGADGEHRDPKPSGIPR
jgi:hypothetical protein